MGRGWGTYRYLRGPGPTAGCACPFEQEIPPEKESEGSSGHVQVPLPSPAPRLPQRPTLLHGWRPKSEAKGSSKPSKPFPQPLALKLPSPSLHPPLLQPQLPSRFQKGSAPSCHLPHAVPSTWMPLPVPLSQATPIHLSGPGPNTAFS